MQGWTDEQLMSGWAAGDEAAFEALVHRHAAGIKGYAMRLLRSPEQAEEVYVEAFARAAQTGRSWTGPSVRGWLYTVTHRLCIDILRRRQVERAAAPGLIALAESRRMRPNAEALAVLGEQARLLEDALQELPQENREALLLRVVHGLSGAETAEALGLTRTQVDSAVSYARKRLKRILGSQAVAGSQR